MKKLITILTIAIVLVSAIFAADEQPSAANGATRIDVTAKVEVVAPRFSLGTDDLDDLTANKASGVVSGNTASNITVQETVNMKDTVAAALAAGTAQTISFVIRQTQDSRINTVYHLRVTATNLKLNGTSTTAHEFFTCTTTSPAVSGINPVTDGNTTSPTNLATFAPASSGSNDLVATYYGGFVEVSTKLTNNVIGSFDVSWNGDPLAAAGTYTANVILEVSAT